MDTSHFTANCIRVLIADDHALVRQGLRTFLELSNQGQHSQGNFLPIQIVGEAANGREAVEIACATRPDIVLLDLVMPELDGLQAIPKIWEGSPGSRILVLTSFTEDDKILPAIQAGANSYLLKDIAPGGKTCVWRSASTEQRPASCPSMRSVPRRMAGWYTCWQMPTLAARGFL